MENTQESIADIVAEMRTKAECAKPYDDGIVMMLTVLADRLEAALKRERLLSKPPENDNSAPVVSTDDNSGNAAAMREALEHIEKLTREFNVGNYSRPDYVQWVLDSVRFALAALPRNCDVGTADEQYKRFMNMCNSKDAKQCASCSMRGFTPGCSRDRCFANWAQMPYEKGGAK